MLDQLQQLKQKIDFKPQTIGVFVSSGMFYKPGALWCVFARPPSAESLRRNERPSYSVKKYINLVQQLNRRHFTKKIFVATDDERLGNNRKKCLSFFVAFSADLSRVASEFPEFEWSFQHRRRLVTDTERAIHIILDLFLLADCEFFVASMAMETPRIVYAVRRCCWLLRWNRFGFACLRSCHEPRVAWKRWPAWIRRTKISGERVCCETTRTQ